MKKSILLLDTLFTNSYLKFLFVSLVGLSILFGMFITPDGYSYMEAANNTLRGFGFIVNCNLMPVYVFQRLYS
jgi:hypothetical protein